VAGGTVAAGSNAYAGVLTTAANYPLQFGINDTVKVTIDTSGNVGIGTTNPGYKLDVNGDIGDSAGAFNIRNLNQLIFNNSTKIAQNDPVNYSMAFYTGSGPTENMVIRENGNVGIGTTNPLGALHVQGTTDLTWAASGPSSGLAIIGTPGTGGSLWVNTIGFNNGNFNTGLGITGSNAGNNMELVNINAYGVKSTGYSSNP
jgi:hypothetical protein